jgi:peptidylprolyl isomerase
MNRTLLLAAAMAAVASATLAQPRAPAAKMPPIRPAVGARPALTLAAPPAEKPAAADWRTPNPEDVLVIDTNKGRILVEMVPEAAPAHVQRVRELTREKLYDGLRFFRVVDGFMAQTGDPENTGTGGSTKPDMTGEFMFRRGADMPFTLAVNQQVAEVGFIKSLPVMSQGMMLAALTRDQKVSGWTLFCPGVAGMARGTEPNSANSQFFLMRAAYPSLERNYTGWGRVISGQSVVTAIKAGEPVPDPQDRMERVRVLADLPEAERPNIRVIDPAGAWFKGEVARAQARGGDNFSACDVNIPVEVK